MKTTNIENECHICGYVGKISFEHVPPRKAFNSHRAFMYLGEQIIKNKDNFPWEPVVKGVQMQRGVGFNTLCERCNSNTGSWYGGAFVDFIYQGYRIIGKNNEGVASKTNSRLSMPFQNIYPLRIIKQIVSMFFSINSPRFAKAQPDLVKFVLDKKSKGLSEEKYGLYIYILNGAIARYIGIAGILGMSKSESRVVSELSAPPFGYVLEMNPTLENRAKECNIIYFANKFEYSQKVNLMLNLPVYESNSYFPLDYRSRPEILKDYINNLYDEMMGKSSK